MPGDFMQWKTQREKPGDGRSLGDIAAIELLDALRNRDYRFTTVSPATHAKINSRWESQTARDLRGIFGWNRPFDREVVGPDIFELMRSADILAQDADQWISRVRVSSLGDQLFMHSAYPTLQADTVFFGPDTYRFANAIASELHARKKAGAGAEDVHRAIDLGCGAGAGAMTIANAFPAAEVLAIDINATALRLTAINARAASVPNIRVLASNFFSDVDGSFDLIVANPPYMVDASARTYRHGGGKLGEGLSVEIVRAALPRLAPGGTLILYTGVAMVDGFDCFHDVVRPLLDASGWRWSYAEVDPDIFPEELLTETYRHAERIAAVVLRVSRPL